MKKQLPNLEVICCDCYQYGLSISSIKKTLLQIEPAKTTFFTDIKAYNPNFPFAIHKIDKIGSVEEYSTFMLKELGKHLTADFVLVIQHDSGILDVEQWDDRFLEYDYIGACWLEEKLNVGNGGFSIRSKRLQQILAEDDFILPLHPEDNTICKLYRPYLEQKYGIRFAPPELAEKFAYELREPNQPTFGYHGSFHPKYKPTVVVKRSAATGDCVAVEPLLKHLHDKGNHVVIDMPVHIGMMYAQHYFPVKHVTQIDSRIPTTVIDLDGTYEAKPKQLHLQSYYEAAGITDGEIRNPKLHIKVDASTRLFTNKYVVIHIDDRDQPYRNVYGVNWVRITQRLKDEGYEVIQIGLNTHYEIPEAIQFQTATINLLMFLLHAADLFIGVDSGPASVAVALGIKSVIFFGSVDPKVIHPDLSNIKVVEYEKVCDTPKCWGDSIGGTTGLDCVVDAEAPPCTQFTTEMVMVKIEEALNELK